MNNDPRISNWKQEYSQIPVPPQARDRVLAGIAQAKTEEEHKPTTYKKKGGIIMRITKTTGAAAAAAVLAITILTNVNPSIANAMEQIPVIGSIAKVVTFRTYTNQTKQFEADIQVPQISQGESGGAGIAANKSIEDYANELIAMYEKELQESNGEGNYSLDSSYEVVTDNDRYLSIRINTTLTMASGTQFVKIFTVDKTTGQVISLAQLFADQPDMLKKISSNIKEQMVQQMAADSSKVYFYQSDMPEDDFTGLKGDESFYLDDKGQLVVAFDEYVVAPGYMGAVQFTIPESVTGTIK